MNRLLYPAALAAALVHGVPAAAAGLEGSVVTVTGYCCLAPVEPDRFTVPASAVVGAGIEFPSGSIMTLGGRELISSDVDVSPFAIELVYTTDAVAAGGSFNGFAFDFAALGAQRIAGAVLNPASSFAAGLVGLSFDADSVFYSGAGLAFEPGTRVLIDVVLAPVPEPAGALSLAAGLALLHRLVGRHHLRRRWAWPWRSCAA
ncbi:hypothetical protein CLD22_12585 [Rubrivivax gelatinosus]|nr:hypothetical protein [Rubrivivax gelatinosus]